MLGRTTFLQSLLRCTAGVPVEAGGRDRDPAVHPASECRKLYLLPEITVPEDRLEFELVRTLWWVKSWPAMRVISLGIRTVPVLSVAKKLAAPRPTPTAPAAKCGLIRQDEADWLWLSIGCWKTFALLFYSSLLEVITGRGELTVQSWRALRKECLTWFPGAVMSDINDRCRLLSSIVGVLVSSIANWGREKLGPIRRINTPKKRKKQSSTHESKFTNESQSRTEADDRSTSCCVHACMHVHYAQLQLQLCMLFPSIALYLARVTTVSGCSSN